MKYFALGLLMSQAIAYSQDLQLQGYWAWNQNPDPYERYIHLESGKGFYCILDQKSSFQFQVIGDSITTPMNGKNALTWLPGSGNIVISGSEKGETYFDRFHEIDSTQYFEKCGAEESQTSIVTVQKAKRIKSKSIVSKIRRQVLGRH